MTWKDNKAVTKADTYGNLIDICLKGGDSPTAIKICELLEEEAKSMNNTLCILSINLLNASFDFQVFFHWKDFERNELAYGRYCLIHV